MKRLITKILLGVCTVGFLISLMFDIMIHTYYDVNEFKSTSSEYFQQIITVLKKNDRDIEALKKDFKETCIMRAHMASHVYQKDPELLHDTEECRRLASLLHVDEIHFINEEGVIIEGSHQEYYGYSLDMGGQIGYFEPMLSDKSLELCQEMMENTAKKKKMQYAAVWSEDGKYIVQIGMNPKRLLEALDGNNISDIFKLIATDRSSTFYAVDVETNRILASTKEGYKGRKALDIGIDISEIGENDFYEYQKIDGELHYIGARKYNSMVLVRTKPQSDLIRNIVVDAFWFCVYVLMILLLILGATYYFLEKKIIHVIQNINNQLKFIEQGNYDIRLKDDSVVEFSELCASINSMARRLLNFPNKISKALELSEMQIGISEVNMKKNRLTATSRVQNILRLSDEQYEKLTKDPIAYFEERDLWIVEREDLGEHIFSLIYYPDHYIRYQEFVYEDNKLAVMIDVSNQMREKKELAIERDTDVLTGLYNRRAFYRLMESITKKPEIRKDALILLIDLDHLKKVNDAYGHLNGNRYILAFSEMLRDYQSKMKIAARMGGDEFLFVVYGLENRQAGEEIINWLMSNRDIREVVLDNGEEVLLEYSIGYSYYMQEDTDYQSLIKQADEMMYEDKKLRKERRK